jgi:hypothetical protein
LSALRRHAQWIDFAAEHVALDEEADEAVVHLVACSYLMVLDRADLLRLPPNDPAVFSGRATGVYIDGMNRPPRLGEAGDAVGGIEAAGKGQRERPARRLHIA